MADFIVSKTNRTQTVEVEPQVMELEVKIAGLTISIQRSGFDSDPTVSVDAWSDDEGTNSITPKATFTVPAPADKLRDAAAIELYRSR